MSLPRFSIPSIAIALFLPIFVLFLLCANSKAQNTPPSDQDCLECHDVSDHEGNVPYHQLLDSSMHAGFSCVDCHSGITALPHDGPITKVDCGSCHSDVAEIYKWHGRLQFPGGQDIPSCTNCHGIHNILSPSNPNSLANSANLKHTCGACHENIDLVKKHDILNSTVLTVYESSVHGAHGADTGASHVSCINCHGTNGSAHQILVSTNPQSSINHFNIPNTCGNCHTDIAEQYWAGIHGKLVKRGETNAPVCTNCHGEHGIISPKDPRSPVSPNRVAEATCTPCHESAFLNDKYEIPSGRSKTWVDSYHGLKSKEGDIAVANCASCHGAHMILPQSDPLSSINPANVQKTCGQCHPGISATLASAKIHGQPGESPSPIAGVIRKIYVVLIVLVIGFMLLYVAIDYRKQLHLIRLTEQVQRMTGNEVFQHWLLLITFLVLVVTGFALRYSDSWWVRILFGWEGGFPLRGIIHRIAATLFILTTFWHLFYLTSARGKQFIRDMLPKRRDVNEGIQMIRYNLNTIVDRPQFARFSYIEKMEYWALVWGTAIMIVSGLFLWFDNFAVRYFPKWLLDVMGVVHFYEAILASLAILIWHVYSTVFSPSVYPMNPAWINGKMPKAILTHEHPDDPAFRESRPADDSAAVDTSAPDSADASQPDNKSSDNI